jgi:hypothetical protein
MEGKRAFGEQHHELQVNDTEILVRSRKHCTLENTASILPPVVCYSYYCGSTVNAVGLPTCTYISKCHQKMVTETWHLKFFSNILVLTEENSTTNFTDV